ncbi:hypothetical protein [Streptomyces sp. SLBN-8D4]|uniref:5'-methylthioadenosine/S-adenosylhomocysteine nucleosidase family protein n=1 Tax=Streptomyces sp. SLBN-8D4 TaxID=3377728 RepID=UPI003C7C57B9
MTHNKGIVNRGSKNTFSTIAIGDKAHASTTAPQPSPEPGAVEANVPWDLGIVTILSEELRSVIDALKLNRHKTPTGLYFYQGEHTVSDTTLRIVATQTQSQGQRSTMAALENLRRHYNPRLWALAGIAGGIHDDHARIGNVIVSTDVVYYENRKINPHDTRRRGEHRQAPAHIVHAVNAYFTEHGTPARINGQTAAHAGEQYEVYPGVIGSGEAVIADRASDIRTYLTTYHEKVLAVDMEAGGLSQYWQENSVHGTTNPGWIVIRGVSDNADEHKGHSHHELASRNAAHVLSCLLPYFC